MTKASYLIPDNRGVLAVGGNDRHSFLQGLISNDINKVAADRALWSALLTPQGKYLHDFFIAEIGDVFYIDCEFARRQDLLKRLSLYKLRSKVTVGDATETHAVAVVYGEDALALLDLPAEPGDARAFHGGVAYVDPRLAALGARAILPRASAEHSLQEATLVPGSATAYDRLRVALGVPDGSRDLKVEKAILLENGFDELNGIDWDKGCYMGQELTARTRYRGLVRKRLMPVEIDGPAPDAGTPVMLGDKEAGEIVSTTDGLALAMLRLEYLDPPPAPGAFTAGTARLTPVKPDWAKF